MKQLTPLTFDSASRQASLDNLLPSQASAAGKSLLSDGTNAAWTSIFGAFFGTGADGALTFDGSTTILGIVPSANVYTLATDIFPTTMVVNTGVTVITKNCRIIASVSITTNGTGIIHCNGNAGGVLTGGTVQTFVSYNSGGAGAAGRATVGVGANGVSISLCLGGAGGAGGADVAQAGGTGGLKIASGVQFSKPFWFPAIVNGYQHGASTTTVQYYGAGAGGGAGGNATGAAANSGSGGGGGGFLGLFAPLIVNNGTMSANGGNGSNATGTTSGGGGGGGGGCVLMMYHTLTNNGTISVNGGTHGNGVGAGSNGVDGSAGSLVQLAI